MPMHVAECYIYPLKSGRTIAKERLELTPKGPKFDRLWMLVHEKPERRGLFITQRDKGCARLGLVESIPFENRDISFKAPGFEQLNVRFQSLTTYEDPVEIWGEQCKGVDAGDEAASWFSQYLGVACRLVRIDPDYTRPTEPEYSNAGDQVSFADKYPLHITSATSLEKLQEYLPVDERISMQRFRSNIVIQGLEPFEEDMLHEVRIGEVLVEFVKPSIRCSMTTIDQENAVAHSDEPLRTLGKVRKGKGRGLQGVFFGQNVIHRELGTIHVGDPVEIISKKSVHPALQGVALGVKSNCS